MKQLLIIMAIVQIAQHAFCQDEDDRTTYYHPAGVNNIIPPSPDAASLGKYAEIPVSEFTGIPNISVPLYNIQAGDIQLPVSVSYHSGGIKVQEEASTVGLGWALNAGGVITRSMVGLPDDKKYAQVQSLLSNGQYAPQGCECSNIGYLYNGEDVEKLYNNTFVSNNKYEDKGEFLRHIAIGSIDGDPDIFFFNFGGKTGKFVFDKYGNPQLFSKDNLKITYTIGDNPSEFDIYEYYPYEGTSITSFTVIDEKGIKYTFDAVEWSVSVSGIKDEATWNNNPFKFYTANTDPKTHQPYPSAWYLTKIEEPNKNNVVEFTYEEEGHSNISTYQESSYYGQKNPSETGWGYDYYHFRNNSKTSFIKKKIKTIVWNDNEVIFNYDFTRSDGASSNTALSSLEINNKTKNIKNFKFDYTYFNSEGIDNVTDDKKYAYRRLKLDAVTELSEDLLKEKEPYRFYYNTDVNLPYRYSCEIDFWGFYNNNGNGYTTVNEMTPKIFVYPEVDIATSKFHSIYSVFERPNDGLEYIIDGADRESNENVIQANILNVIEYPTKGRDYLYYSINKFDLDGQPILGGGLRIESIKRYSNYWPFSNEYTVTNYSYKNSNGNTSGLVTEIPRFAFYIVHPSRFADLNLTEPDKWKYSTKVVSNNYTGMGMTTKGGLVGYTNVTIESENGSIEKEFSFPAPFGVDEYIINNNEIIFTQTIGSESHSNAPFAPNPNFDFFRGNLLSEKVKNIEDFTVKETTSTYEILDYSKIYAVSSKIGSNSFQCGMSCATAFSSYSANYYYLSARARKTSDVVIMNYPNQHSITETTNYSYNGIGQISSVETINNLEEKNETTYTYPIDYVRPTSSPTQLLNRALWRMSSEEMNMLDFPIEIVKYKDEKVIGASIMFYKEFNENKNICQSDIVSLYIDKPILDYESLNSTGDPDDYFELDGRYKSNIHFDSYDTQGNLLQYHKEGGNNISYVWGYDGTYPIAKVENASSNQIYHENYEEDLNAVESNYCTGRKSALVTNNNYTGVNDFAFVSLERQKYILSAWIKTTADNTWFHIKKFDGGTYFAKTKSFASTGGEWKYIEFEADLGDPGFENTTQIRCEIRNLSGADIYVDDVAFRPANSMVTTYTYDPLIGMTSETNPNGKTTYYEYDDFGRLKCIKDHKGYIVKQYDYKYSTQTAQ